MWVQIPLGALMVEFIRGWVVPLAVGFIAGDFLWLLRKYLQARISEIESKKVPRE